MDSPLKRLAYKQYPVILDRLNRQNLALQRLGEYFGLKAFWDHNDIEWKNIKKPRRQKQSK